MRSVSRRIVGQNEFTRIPPKLANGHSEQSSKESLSRSSLLTPSLSLLLSLQFTLVSACVINDGNLKIQKVQ